MAEIRIDADLPYPPGLVWRALTDPVLLSEWFMQVRCEPDPRSPVGTARCRLEPDGQPGFEEPLDIAVLDREREVQLVTQWRGNITYTTVTVTLHHTASGCRLSLVQSGFFGQQGTLRRRTLQRTLSGILATQLPETLRRLETVTRERGSHQSGWGGGHSDLWRPGRRNDARFTSTMARPATMAWAGIKAAGRNVASRSPSTQGMAPWKRRAPAKGVAVAVGEALGDSPTAAIQSVHWVPRTRARRARPARARWWALGLGRPTRAGAIVASAALLVLVTSMAVLVDRVTAPGGPGTRATTSDPRSVLLPGGQGAGATADDPGGSVATAPVVPGAEAPESAQTLSATYRTGRTVVGGYEGVVVVSNLSARVVNGWSVRIVLPPLGLIVHHVDGALAIQREREVAFTPDASTRVVPAGDKVQFTFQVQGVGEPVECAVDGHSCVGVFR